MTPTARYDAARAAVDALENAMNGPGGCPNAVRAVLREHEAALADLCAKTSAQFRAVLEHAPDAMLCPSAAAEAAGEPFDPFDRAQRWTFARFLGDATKDHLATMRHEATTWGLTCIAPRIVQRVIVRDPEPGTLDAPPPEVAVSIVALGELFEEARCADVALDFGEAVAPMDPVLVLHRTDVVAALRHVRSHMRTCGVDATFKGRVTWEVVTPAQIVRPKTSLPFQERADIVDEADWEEYEPEQLEQRVGATVRARDMRPLYGPVRRLPPVYKAALTLHWSDAPTRKGHIRFLCQSNHDVAGRALTGAVDLVRVGPAPVAKPVASTKPKTKRSKAA
jgi:hypothetical protein